MQSDQVSLSSVSVWLREKSSGHTGVSYCVLATSWLVQRSVSGSAAKLQKGLSSRAKPVQGCNMYKREAAARRIHIYHKTSNIKWRIHIPAQWNHEIISNILLSLSHSVSVSCIGGFRAALRQRCRWVLHGAVLWCCCHFQLLPLSAVITSTSPALPINYLRPHATIQELLQLHVFLCTILGSYISGVQGCDVTSEAAVFILMSSFHPLSESAVCWVMIEDLFWSYLTTFSTFCVLRVICLTYLCKSAYLKAWFPTS